MPNSSKRAQFERVVLPHLNAAYNLARWLTRDDHDAQDVLQESSMRAYQYLDGFHGDSAKSWLLTIVRHTCYSWLEKNRPAALTTVFDEQLHGAGGDGPHADNTVPADGPEALLQQKQERHQVQRWLEELPVEFREVVVLRELEGLSYKEIGEIAAIPIGTVMSRLSRGRNLLQRKLNGTVDEES
ncbi:MAG: sigma-70 family RNA polymerase sigma factor [Gammaproteobacteria bacterium]|nr:sigma-70 family RNA polymerase sigma factor [Gammaproteobacteria bacterium]